MSARFDQVRSVVVRKHRSGVIGLCGGKTFARAKQFLLRGAQLSGR